MYVNPAFKSSDREALAFARERGFGAVVAMDGVSPVAAHVPFLMRETNGIARLEAHVAKANPLHEVIAANPRVLLIVSGADAYVSPDWYVSEYQVPTWNYSAVHLSGVARTLPAERTLAHVEAISLDREARLLPKKPWSTSKMPEQRLQMMLAAIVAFEIVVDRVEAAFKLGQNKSTTDVYEASRMLEWRGTPGERSVAKAMRMSMKSARSA